MPDHTLDGILRVPGLVKQRNESLRAEWGQRRGLKDDGITARKRWPDLVRDQKERVVKRRDRNDDPDGDTQAKPESAGAIWTGIQRKHFLVRRPYLRSAQPQERSDSPGLPSSLRTRLALLLHDQVGELLNGEINSIRRPLEKHSALVRRQPGEVTRNDGRAFNRGMRLMLRCAGHLVDHLAGVRIRDSDDVHADEIQSSCGFTRQVILSVGD